MALDSPQKDYKFMYCSDKGWVYYDIGRKDAKKQLWTIHKKGAAGVINSRDEVYFTNCQWPSARLRVYDGYWLSCENDPENSAATLHVHQTLAKG
jgi:hypothetical protein